MGALLRVQVPPRAGHGERSEAQLRKGDRPWGERAPAQAVIEESADAVVGGDTEGLKEWRAEDSRYRRTTASDAHFDGARMNTRGDEIHAARAVRNVIRRPCCTKLKSTRSVVYSFQPPGADPHARWRGGSVPEGTAPIPISSALCLAPPVLKLFRSEAAQGARDLDFSETEGMSVCRGPARPKHTVHS